ncbi:MAG: FGGY-family carbohydrate kinase, partial [Oscillospiraceae bacterium]
MVASSDIVGTLAPGVAAELGLAPETPVCAGGVDCGVAHFGMGIFEEGRFAAAIGTSMCAAFVHAEPIPAKELIAWPYVYRPEKLDYSFGGGATAGAVIKWFRDTFGEAEKAVESSGGPGAYFLLDKEAETIEPGAEGLVVLPYFMGERSPLWDTNAKGVIYGLSLVHTKAHIYRAFLEAVAYSLRHTIEAAGADLGDTILLAGGVSRSRLWRQIFADVTGYNVVCPLHDVEANLGDVMLAGLGTGLLAIEDIKKWNVLDEKIAPIAENHRRYNHSYGLYRQIYQDLKGTMASF